MKIPRVKIALLIGFTFGLFTSLTNAGTVLQVCHAGGPRVFAAVYETYQGILSGYKVVGWWGLEDGKCMKEVIYSRYVRAYAFAAVNEEGQFVTLPFDFNLPSRMLPRGTTSFCVPVQEKLDSFKLESAGQSGVVPPCHEGQAPLATSFNIWGSDTDQRIQMNVRVPDVLPPPDATYTKIWEEMFGTVAMKRELEEKKLQQKRRAAREKQKAEKRKQQQAVKEAREAEKKRRNEAAREERKAVREKHDVYIAGAERIRAQAFKRQATSAEVLAYFSHPDFGCLNFSELRSSIVSKSEGKIDKVCADFEGLSKDPEYSEMTRDIDSFRRSAWNVEESGWPKSTTLCAVLGLYTINSAILERLAKEPDQHDCNRSALRSLEASLANAIGLSE